MLYRVGSAEAQVIEDSISEAGVRLTTVQTRYWRPIHAELMTHRVFSRNGRSSRAVPVATILEEAKNPYVPNFCLNKPGMQAGEALDPETAAEAEKIWREMAEFCRVGVARLNELKVHKQWSNRALEWFGYIDVLITSVAWNNFDILRDHDAAQPEIQDLAKAIKLARENSRPKSLNRHEWHLPYVLPSERDMDLEVQKKLSVARCARLSYKPFDGNASLEKELERFEKLVVSQPVHASPAEHQARPDPTMLKPELHGNLPGWIQFRKTLPNEFIPG